jgi:hypothetical protein
LLSDSFGEKRELTKKKGTRNPRWLRRALLREKEKASGVARV